MRSSPTSRVSRPHRSQHLWEHRYQAPHSGSRRLRHRLLRLRSRWLARHPGSGRHALRRNSGRSRQPAVQEQSRWNVPGRHREIGPGASRLGFGRCHRRLQQRRPGRPVPHLLRQNVLFRNNGDGIHRCHARSGPDAARRNGAPAALLSIMIATVISTCSSAPTSTWTRARKFPPAATGKGFRCIAARAGFPKGAAICFTTTATGISAT
jgi:hypothetical protein